MEEIKKVEQTTEGFDSVAMQEEESSFDIRTIFTLIVLNWQWFLLSMFIFVCGALLYLRYATPTYQMSVKMLIKEETNNRRGGSQLANMQDFGFMTNSAGLDNEIEILKSKRLAQEAVKDLKLYTEYYTKGRIKEQLLYKTQPVNADLDPVSLDSLYFKKTILQFKLEKEGNKYIVTSKDKLYPFEASFTNLPATVKSPLGSILFTENPENKEMENGQSMTIFIYSPLVKATFYTTAVTVEPTSKLTTIAKITLKDINAERASDYLKQLALCYNRQANADKNEIAYKTEAFINSRLEKINTELGITEGELENYKKRNNITQLRLDATQLLNQSNSYTDRLAQANTQIQLLDYLREYVAEPENKYQIIPSNVGLTDPVSSSLISTYNKEVQDRNRLLEAASETSPQVMTLTNTLDRLQNSINDALMQARKTADIQRQGIQQQYNLYQDKVANTPEQERILTQIGRQQEVKSGLYLMLLQKREENSISLAATADKGRLIDDPSYGGKVSPKGSIIMLAAIILGFALPLLITYLLQFLRYKIEGHEDVMRLTKLPIVADVAVANESAKSSAGIVVHENKNNQTDEIFRSMRTNIQFMLAEQQKVILFTSSQSGEGKTFNAANLAVSFALLGKKVILMGLDIRKPALGRLFNITDRQKGITTLLVKDHVTKEELYSQISPSGVNAHLDLLLAGPTPPNPTELLARQTLADIVDILRSEYDYIIMDTAPVGLVTDTLQIGRCADVTAFVCRADYTPKSSFGLINGLDAEKKLPNMCIVINGIDMSKKKYGYYYGYGKYGKYGRYGYGYGYGRYGRYGYGSYGGYGGYGSYGSYGNYSDSHYGNKNDDSIKK
ncbi:MAG: polysaccharide biosynthesis tyrosine autokinase [Prevotella sp.]|nr:polysaccharide biosynthesis tyrosine autokinase [Prevotella sp.]